MRVVTSARAMQSQAKKWQRRGGETAFVPTMGYLHAGHLSLIKTARRLVGKQGRVVVSIYVNPTQFGPKEDLAAYPRNLRRDRQLCEAAGVDVLFVPSDGEMYPPGTDDGFSTYVVEERLSKPMEGASRPTHFRGVTTVVAKLFNLVLPDAAVFGAKDYQQAAVIRRMVRDLNFPVKIVVAPTKREPDGLAMSSRNSYLTAAQRGQAVVLWESICEAQEQVARRVRSIKAEDLRRRLTEMIERRPEAEVDYIEFFDGETLAPAEKVGRGTHMALAVRIGKTRLIDNAAL